MFAYPVDIQHRNCNVADILHNRKLTDRRRIYRDLLRGTARNPNTLSKWTDGIFRL